ncbi:MAG: hypothetical protein ACLS43_11820 [Evtepia gabavorous]
MTRTEPLGSYPTGASDLPGGAVVLATGCRAYPGPSPSPAPGRRWYGGTAQNLMNTKNFWWAGVVVLGSGDIGLIMARRMTLEGPRSCAWRKAAAPAGWRNVRQCLTTLASRCFSGAR